jgi:hypothetical protein
LEGKRARIIHIRAANKKKEKEREYELDYRYSNGETHGTKYINNVDQEHSRMRHDNGGLRGAGSEVELKKKAKIKGSGHPCVVSRSRLRLGSHRAETKAHQNGVG